MGSNPTPRTVTEPPFVLVSPRTPTGLVNYVAYLLSHKALKHSTIERKEKALNSVLKNGVNLDDVDAVVRFLNTCSWANGTKEITMNAYRDYLDMRGLVNITLPKFRVEDKYPFIPLEAEIDSIISSVRMKMSALVRVLKETAARPIEAWRIRWIDIDAVNRAVTLTPAKYSRPRKLKISEQTLNMVSALPRKHGYVFSVSGESTRFEDELEHFARNYQKARNRIADKLHNPRLRLISLRTLRHWKATMEYVRTKDIVHVKEFLGHVNIQNTLKYVHLANAVANNEANFVCKVAKTVEEAAALIQQGFDYVTEFEDLKLFRKPK